METIETNVAKIEIGNSKQTNTYVSTLAERTIHEDSELFAVVALPLFNPAALPDCERIANGLLGALRRCYKRSNNENTFEVALGEMNDEVGKLATLGQHNWTGKISAVVGVRQGNKFYASTTGKAVALLMRGGEFNEITESSTAKHPLKTFDTFSSGRIKLGDVIIITTSELFNHVSLDRIKNILSQNTLEIAAQEIVRVVEDTAGPEVSFGTLLLQETEPLALAQENLELSSYRGAPTPGKLLGGLANKARKLVSMESAKSIWQTVKSASSHRPNLNIKKLSGLAVTTTTQSLSVLATSAKNYKNIDYKAPLNMFRNLNRAKQFFVVSVFVLLLAVIVNIFVARSHRTATVSNTTFETSKAAIQKLLNDADSKLIFKDEAAASTLLSGASQQLQSLNTTTDAQVSAKKELEQQLNTLSLKVNKIEAVNPNQLATLSNAENLTVLPNILATATGKVVISFNTNTNTTEDGTVHTSADIVESVNVSPTESVVFDGQGLNLWNFVKGTNSTPFYLNVPKSASLAGLAHYPTNNRVYTVDTDLGQVISYLVSATGFSKPTVSVKDSKLKDALDLGIDGNIYVLTKTGINKYNAGKPVSFTFPSLTTPFSGKGKIYTNEKTKQVYVLDSNGRVIITDKTGKLIKVLQSDSLNGASDFAVDETNKVIYVLRNGSLLKIDFSL